MRDIQLWIPIDNCPLLWLVWPDPQPIRIRPLVRSVPRAAIKPNKTSAKSRSRVDELNCGGETMREICLGQKHKEADKGKVVERFKNTFQTKLTDCCWNALIFLQFVVVRCSLFVVCVSERDVTFTLPVEKTWVDQRYFILVNKCTFILWSIEGISTTKGTDQRLHQNTWGWPKRKNIYMSFIYFSSEEILSQKGLVQT